MRPVSALERMKIIYGAEAQSVFAWRELCRCFGRALAINVPRAEPEQRDDRASFAYGFCTGGSTRVASPFCPPWQTRFLLSGRTGRYLCRWVLLARLQTMRTCAKTRSEFWQAKLLRNRQRDRRVTHDLKAQGIKVIRIWEHSLRTSALVDDALSTIRTDWHENQRLRGSLQQFRSSESTAAVRSAA